MEKKINRFVYWTPRILSIIFILFLMIFSLDVFESGSNAREIAIGLLLHNIPALILLAIVVISWNHEIIGGVVFILAAIAYIILMLATRPLETGLLMAILVVAGPAFLIGILFIINWRKKRLIY